MEVEPTWSGETIGIAATELGPDEPTNTVRRRERLFADGDWRASEAFLEVRSHSRPADVPDAILLRHRRAQRVVVFLHGWRGCIRVLFHEGEVRCGRGNARETGWGLGNVFREAELPTTYVMLQLAYRQREGSAGRYLNPDFANDTLKALLGDQRDLPITLVAHSAGYEATLAFLREGPLETQIDSVILMDALYGGAQRFGDWVLASPNRNLISVHRPGSTRVETRRLRRVVTRRGLNVGPLGSDAPVWSLEVQTGHVQVPATHLHETLGALYSARANSVR